MFLARYPKEVAEFRERINSAYSTNFSDLEIFRLITSTIIRHGKAHANMTLKKSFPDLNAQIAHATDLFEDTRPTQIERLRSPMAKVLQAYAAVISEAAARGDCTIFWDGDGKFAGWFWDISSSS